MALKIFHKKKIVHEEETRKEEIFSSASTVAVSLLISNSINIKENFDFKFIHQFSLKDEEEENFVNFLPVEDFFLSLFPEKKKREQTFASELNWIPSTISRLNLNFPLSVFTELELVASLSLSAPLFFEFIMQKFNFICIN